jgi:hypothetical protein
MRVAALFLALVLSCFCISAPAGIQELVAAYLKDHAMELRLSDGRLAGPAADWFRAEAAKAQFFFIGEEHDVREIPLIAGALWRELVPLGYKHVAIEAGPWLGGRLDRFARFGDAKALSQFQAATWPRLPNNSVPPISQEDIAFYELLGKVSGPHRASAPPLIWGLDYEYRATPLLRRLTELTPRGARRTQIESLLSHVETAEAAGLYDTESFRQEIEQVIRAAPAKPGTEEFQLLDGLQWRIMDHSDRNSRDVKKELFLRQYRAAKRAGEAAPRVMLRFGGYHAARGLMHDFGRSTLANLVAELALTERSTMLNVLLINCRGTSPADFPRPCTWEYEEWMKVFRDAAAGSWTLFDLRGLRAAIRQARLNTLQAYPEGWEFWNLVMSYDALVLLTRSERSHLPQN